MKLFTLFVFVFISIHVFSQDIIVRHNGERVHCKITDEDSTNVYFDLTRDGRVINTFLPKPMIKEIHYGYENVNRTSEPDYDETNSITVGILQGGGSLVGLDYEVLLTNRFGIQAGAGFIGFGGGVNLHFKPYIRSTFLSFQYYHQGIGSGYTQSLMGPCVVFRARKWFSAQLGIGWTLEKGPAWPTSMEQPPVMLTYAIGIYFPREMLR